MAFMLNSRIAQTFYWIAVALSVSAARSEAGTSTHVYGVFSAQLLYACVPDNNATRRSGVLLIYGGGWTGGQAMRGRCLSFAKNGIVAFALGYRLADLSDPSTRWPAQLDDAEAALQWIFNHAQSFDLDPRHVCVYGESAGGHIALWQAIKDHRVACVIDAFGPTDLNALDPKSYKGSFDALFGTGEGRALGIRNASPLSAVTADIPPVFIIQGERDRLVPPEQSLSLFDAVRALGRPVTISLYAGGHSWQDLGPVRTSAIMDQVMVFIKSSPAREVPSIGPHK